MGKGPHRIAVCSRCSYAMKPNEVSFNVGSAIATGMNKVKPGRKMRPLEIEKEFSSGSSSGFLDSCLEVVTTQTNRFHSPAWIQIVLAGNRKPREIPGRCPCSYSDMCRVGPENPCEWSLGERNDGPGAFERMLVDCPHGSCTVP